jgi:stage V sporulation protein SpoVS
MCVDLKSWWCLALQVMAIGQARLQLESDGKNVQAWPEFVKVDKDGRQLNAIKFHVLVLG